MGSGNTVPRSVVVMGGGDLAMAPAVSFDDGQPDRIADVDDAAYAVVPRWPPLGHQTVDAGVSQIGQDLDLEQGLWVGVVIQEIDEEMRQALHAPCAPAASFGHAREEAGCRACTSGQRRLGQMPEVVVGR